MRGLSAIFRFVVGWQNVLMAMLIIALTLVGLRFWPHSPLSEGVPLSTAFYDRNGQLLRLTLASDDRYRIWTPLAAISPAVIKGVQLHEDQWFYYHPGFNPVSLLRGAWISYVKGGHRQGGSTITMQLARLHWRLNTRSPTGKIKQVLRAIQLELFYSKDEILEAYLNYAPYGRNVESIGAASLIYFNKAANELTLPEALTLSVLPQSPSYRLDKKTGVVGESLTKARNRLFERWRQTYPTDSFQDALFALPLALKQPEQLPFAAPHFVEQIAKRHHAKGYLAAQVNTTLDLELQRLVEEQINAFLVRNRSRGIHNAAAMLVDSRDMSVVALVGSADYFDRAIHGQVNGTHAKRSPGSTLKPFIYGLAIDQGILHPMTVLKDVPTSFSAYSPENFDRRFMGPVTATQALIYSRNVPAVYVASRLSKPSLYQFLRQAGVGSMASEKHYGLSLALGGGEITMQELAQLYAMLANRGTLRKLRFEREQAPENGVRLISDEASFITLDMLSQNPRPDDILAQQRHRLPVYWKTGTSWGFKDAWSAGIVGPYVLTVWLGNFSGKGNTAFVGGDSAAPLFFNIINSLQAQYPALAEPVRPKPENVKKVDICLASGDLLTVWCQRKGQTWFIPGKSPIKVDSVYRPVVIDERTGLPACPPYTGIPTRTEVYEYWPSDIRAIFANAGLPKRMPPDMGHCRQNIRANSGHAPRITSPLLNTTYTLRGVRMDKERIVFTAVTDNDVKDIYWFVDDVYLGSVRAGQSLIWLPSRSGDYRVRIVDDHGRADSRRLKINIIH